ncbi:MAG: glycosyltransferase family 1 protein [Gemmatimonadaceae bacterium]
MRIAVHAKVLSEDTPTGIGLYVQHLLRALAAMDRKNEYSLYSNKALVHRFANERFRERRLRFPPLWTYLRWPFEFAGRAFDLAFVPKEVVPPFIRTPTVITVYDLMGLMFPDRVAMDGKLHYFLAVKAHIPRAHAILAISECTKREVVETCGVDPRKVFVTPLGVDADMFAPPPRERVEATRLRYGLTRPYFINTSSVLWYRKNLARLVRAFRLCREIGRLDHQLVITGKRGEAQAEIEELVASFGLDGKVRMLGYVPREEMPALLGGAEALVFPSLHEGFGLPVLEAMASGCPVITSDRSALPEVAGSAAILVTPEDVDAIAAAMIGIANDAELRAGLRAKGLTRAREFTWERTARLTLDVFERVGCRA